MPIDIWYCMCKSYFLINTVDRFCNLIEFFFFFCSNTVFKFLQEKRTFRNENSPIFFFFEHGKSVLYEFERVKLSS